MVTYYVIQSFQKGRKGAFIPTLQRHARDKAHCEMLAEKMSDSHDCVVAFSRSGEPDTDEWQDAVILAQYGKIPDAVLEFMR
ncbi:hypothetical protein [Rhizobium sp. 23-156Da]